jgi:hypothetical protein
MILTRSINFELMPYLTKNVSGDECQIKQLPGDAHLRSKNSNLVSRRDNALIDAGF